MNINVWFISLKTRAKRERVVTWWKPAAQTRPVLVSSFFAPVLTLPHRTCQHSASSLLAVRINCALSQCLCSESPYLSIKIYCIYVCHTNITLYRVIHKAVKHFKNSQQIDYATDHGNSSANSERHSSSFFYICHRCSMCPTLVIRQTSMR
jgi:hypothetical protein